MKEPDLHKQVDGGSDLHGEGGYWNTIHNTLAKLQVTLRRHGTVYRTKHHNDATDQVLTSLL